MLVLTGSTQSEGAAPELGREGGRFSVQEDMQLCVCSTFRAGEVVTWVSVLSIILEDSE